MSAMDSHGLWRNCFVCHGQLWLVKQNVFFLPWTVMVGRKSDFVCCGKLSLVEELFCLPLTAMFGRAKDLGWY